MEPQSLFHSDHVWADHPLLGTCSHLSTKEGWEVFALASRSRAPKRLSLADWRAMAPRDREEFDRQRMEHHANFGPILTTQLKRIRAALRAQLMANLSTTLPGARRGSIIDGHGGLGKTTILVEFGRAAWRALHQRNGAGLTAQGDLYVPVVYISLAAATTIKGFNRQVLDFYGVPTRSHATVTDLSLLVKKVARRCGTVLFLVDDVHFLPMRSDPGQIVNDHLKYLANETAATFVYAGIDCVAGGLLNEGGRHGKAVSQTSTRFTLHSVHPFARDTAAAKREWVSLLMGAEGEVVLLEARPGDIVSLERYIFDRTSGEIGAALGLVRAGAHHAMVTERERITEPLLDEISLDYHADTAFFKRRGAKIQPVNEDAHVVDHAIARIVQARGRVIASDQADTNGAQPASPVDP